MPEDFMECDTCSTKPGAPTLCRGCLENRKAIESLKTRASNADFLQEEVVRYSRLAREQEKTIAYLANSLRSFVETKGQEEHNVPSFQRGES